MEEGRERWGEGGGVKDQVREGGGEGWRARFRSGSGSGSMENNRLIKYIKLL